MQKMIRVMQVHLIPRVLDSKERNAQVVDPGSSGEFVLKIEMGSYSPTDKKPRGQEGQVTLGSC